MPEETLEKKDQKGQIDVVEVLPEVIPGDVVSVKNPDGIIVKSEVLELKDGDIADEAIHDANNPDSSLEKYVPVEVVDGPRPGEVVKDAEVVEAFEGEKPSDTLPELLLEELDEVVYDEPKGPSIGEKFLKILGRGKELGKNFVQNSAMIAGDLSRRSAKAIRDKASDVAEALKPKLETAINRARDFTDEAVAVIGGMAKVGASKLGDRAVELGGFLKDSGIIIKGEITSRLESAVALAADTLEKISDSDIVQGAVDRISIFKNTMAEAWVGSGVDEFNSFIKQQETGLADIEKSLSSRRSDLANLEQISKDVGFDVSEAAREKLQKDIAKKEAELKSEQDRVDTMKAENSFFEIRRTGYLAKIESSKKNIADRIQAKIDINSNHSEDLQDRLDELSANKRKNSGELEKLTAHFRDLDRLTRETDSEGARRSAVSLMRQIGPRINELEAELIACNKDEGKILKRKAKIDSKLEKSEEQLSDLGTTPRKKDAVDSTREDLGLKVSKSTDVDESIIPTPFNDLKKSERNSENDQPVYFEDSLGDSIQEKPVSKQEKTESKTKLSLDEFLTVWNKDFPEFSLTKGNFATVSKIRRYKNDMHHVILNLVHAQHPGSNPKIVKMCIDAIYKNK